MSNLLTGRQSGGQSILAFDAAALTTPADTTEDILASIVIPGGSMGKSGLLRVSTFWSMTNNANVKTGRIRLGGIGGTQFATLALASLLTAADIRIIFNRGVTNSQLGNVVSLVGAWGTSAVALITGAVDTTLDQTLVITGQKATAGDALVLEAYIVEQLRSD